MVETTGKHWQATKTKIRKNLYINLKDTIFSSILNKSVHFIEKSLYNMLENLEKNLKMNPSLFLVFFMSNSPPMKTIISSFFLIILKFLKRKEYFILQPQIIVDECCCFLSLC